MTLQIYAIHDVKAQCFGNPFFLSHNGIALREFSDLSNDPQSRINKHPEDYKLYNLGEYDDNSGAFTSLSQPKFLANATDFQETKK